MIVTTLFTESHFAPAIQHFACTHMYFSELLGQDIAGEITLRFWRVVQERSQALVRWFNSLPVASMRDRHVRYGPVTIHATNRASKCFEVVLSGRLLYFTAHEDDANNRVLSDLPPGVTYIEGIEDMSHGWRETIEYTVKHMFQ